MGSLSGKSLATSLGVKRVRSTYEAKRRDIIVNWGNSRLTESIPYVENDLNKHTAIALACNKLKTFRALEQGGFQHLPVWAETHYDISNLWANWDNSKVYCRTNLTGHSGHGIIIASRLDELVEAPLYTIDTKHKWEYRVHVFKGSVISVQQKKRRNGYQGADTGIRNHSNGYIYATQDLEYPEEMGQVAIDAVNLLGLDFGAVDIGWNQYRNKLYVFEVNTAPGLTGTTLTNYTNAFKGYLYELNNSR